MLVSVTDNDLRSAANGGNVTSAVGHDIAFMALDTTTCGGSDACTLDHEIEGYEGASGSLLAWVRVPSVNAFTASSDTVVYLYYGDSSVTASTERKAGVWMDHKAVWHLKESAGGTGSLEDSTGNGNAATPHNDPNLGFAGKI